MEKCVLVLSVTFLFLLALCILPACSGFYANGTNYEMPISNLNYGSYDEHSDSYNIDYSLVDQYVGWNDTPDYNATFGFYGAVDFLGYSVIGPFDVFIDAPTSVAASSSATATVEVRNQNPNLGGDYRLDYWIEDESGNSISSAFGAILVPSLSTVIREVSLTAPSIAGTYYYCARVAQEVTYSACESFTVTAADEDGEDGDGAPSMPVLRVTEYPKSITLAQTDFNYFMIEVKNLGRATATNTVLLIENLNPAWFYVEPQSMDIDANESGIFVLNLDIPSDAETGTYDFTIKAVSGSVKHEVNSTLSVVGIEQEIRITDVKTYPEKPKTNETALVQVVVVNSGEDNTTVIVQLSVSDTWEIDNDIVARVIGTGEQEIFEFVFIPREAGVFELTVSMRYDEIEIVKIVLVTIESAEVITPEEAFWMLYLIQTLMILICAPLVMVLLILLLHSRKKRRHIRNMKILAGLFIVLLIVALLLYARRGKKRPRRARRSKRSSATRASKVSEKRWVNRGEGNDYVER